jgi:hypothetical protein
MDDSFLARLGHDPVAIYTRIHGCRPTGIARLGSPPAEAKARQEQDPPLPPAAAAEREGGQPRTSSAHAGEGLPPAPAPEKNPADAAPGGEAAPPAAGPPPARRPAADSEEDLAYRPPDPASCMQDWLVHNWETIKALEAAGRLPELALPPGDEPESAPPGDEPESAPPGAEPAAPPPPPVHVRKGDRWNKHKMAQFLRELAATHSVSAAARSVGMSRESAYRLRNRLKGEPFDIAWEAAFRHGYDALAHAALDRAVNGVEVPHYCNGELVGTSRKFDERLTVALLAMRNRYGTPLVGRYGAAAEWWSERWDAMLQRVETGSVDWRDERQALGQAELARLELPDQTAEVDSLILRHAPEDVPKGPRRR